jgi:NAD-dependent SIR2 family protein deacetylase
MSTPPLSSTYSLPSDLEIRHLRDVQVRIESLQTSIADTKRIEKVRDALQHFNDDDDDDDGNDDKHAGNAATDAIADAIAEIATVDTINNVNDNITEIQSLLGNLTINTQDGFQNSNLQTFPQNNTQNNTQNGTFLSQSAEKRILDRYTRDTISHLTHTRSIPLYTPVATPIFETSPNSTSATLLSPTLFTTKPIAPESEINPENGTSPPPTTPIQTKPRTDLYFNLKPSRVKKIQNFIHAVQAINQAKNIVVVMGAGISVPAGIPDFRSDNGLYKLLNGIDLSKSSLQASDPRYTPKHIARTMAEFVPECLFDLNFFKENPIPFYTFYFKMGLAEEMCQPTFSHKFLKLLEEKGKLRRLYTQNIDNLEYKAGIKNYVACHGNDLEFYCLKCNFRIETKYIEKYLKRHEIPFCGAIREFLNQEYLDRLNPSVKKLPESILTELKKNKNCNGLWKPKIVFFGESLPESFFLNLQSDLGNTDLILVMGTSLQVTPVASIPNRLSHGRGVLSDAVLQEELENDPDLAHFYSQDLLQFQNAMINNNPSRHGQNIILNDQNLQKSKGEFNSNSTTPCTFDKLSPIQRTAVINRYLVDKYAKIKVRTDVSSTHLHQLTRNLTHVPIISINRDSLLPMHRYNPGREYLSEIVRTKTAMERKLLKVFSVPYKVFNLTDNEIEQAWEQSTHGVNAIITKENRNGETQYSDWKWDGKSYQSMLEYQDVDVDDLSDGDYDNWEHDIFITKKPQIKVMPSHYLTRCDYEFLGNADDITQFIVKMLDW